MFFWRFRGSPFYLSRHATRLGLPPELPHSARHNAEIFRVATLCSQLCEHWHRARRENGVPVLTDLELLRLKATIDRIEIEVNKLHVLAAAASDMLGEAREAFGFASSRQSEVTSDVPNIFPLGDGTVGVCDDDELEPALIESGQ
jgi:hypothetical protein